MLIKPKMKANRVFQALFFIKDLIVMEIHCKENLKVERPNKLYGRLCRRFLVVIKRYGLNIKL